MNRNRLSMAIGLTLAFSSAVVHAQQTPPPPPTDDTELALDEIQVTVRRRQETLQDVPVAVTAFTPETLDKLNVQDVGDLDAQVPNLTI